MKLLISIIFLLILGIAVPHFFPFESLVLNCIILPLLVVLLIKYSNNVYLDIFYSLTLIIIQNRFDVIFSSGTLDQVGRDLLRISYNVTTCMVFLVWLVALFTVIKKRQKLSAKKIVSTYFPYLLIMFIIYICLYRYVLFIL